MRSIGKDVVDDFAYTGSPGSGVQSLGTLGVDKEHVWVSGIDHLDWVRGMGPDEDFGRNPEQLEGIGHLSGDVSGAKGYNPNYLGNPYGHHSMYFVEPRAGEENLVLNDLGKVIADVKER